MTPIERIDMETEVTDAGWRVVATATFDKRYLDAVSQWAKREAEAGRLMSVENLPEDLKAIVIVGRS